MGKAQKKKAMRHRHNPIRVPDSHLGPGLAAANASATNAKQVAILPIMQKLESADATERAWACAAVSNLINNDPSTRRLLQGKNVVGVLISRLSDNVDEVVVEACGALRNLAIDGGFDICGEMYNKHIMEPLKGFVPKISSALSAYISSAAPNDTLPFVFQLAENAVTLFWCLSFVSFHSPRILNVGLTYTQETSNKALNAINNVGLVPFLMSLITSRSRFPAKLVIAAAQCLYVLTDDNTPAVEALYADGSAITSLLAVAQAPKSGIAFGSTGSVEQIYTLRVLSCGVLKNISPLPPSSPAADVDLDRTIILPLFVPLLGLDLTTASTTVYNLSTKPTIPIPPELRHTPMYDHRTPDEKELERIETELLTVQLCLEILTGVCANLPDWDGLDASKPKDTRKGAADDDDEDKSESGDDDGDDDEMMDAAEDPPSRVKAASSPSVPPSDDVGCTPTSLLNALTAPLLNLARPTPLSFPPPALPSVHPPTTSVLGAIHVRALECLNNLSVGVKERPGSAGEELSTEEKELVQGAVGVWNQMWGADLLGAVGEPPDSATPGQERRAEMWNIAVGVLWGLARMGKGALNPNEEQVKILIALCNNTKEDKIQVQCIGTLGCLAQCQSAIDANLVISQYLLSVLTAGTTSPPTRFSAEPTLQAGSSLIDIFADENKAYDANFGVAKILWGMSESIKGARKQVRAIDSRKPGGRALRAWADGVLGDLTGFVEYRRKLGR